MDTTNPVGPNAASALKASAVSSTEAALAWTDNSNDEQGFRVMRSDAGADNFAEVGTTAADATSYNDTSATGGSYDYQVFAYSATGQNGSNIATANLPVPAQTATITIDLSVPTATVTSQPAHMNLEIDGAVSWAGDGNPLDFTLKATNTGFHRLVFNLKAVVTATSAGTMALTDGDFAGDPYYFFSNTGILAGASKTVDVQISGLSGTGTLTVDLDLRNHPLLLGSSNITVNSNLWMADSSGTAQQTAEAIAGFGNTGIFTADVSKGRSGITMGVVSPDGRYVYYGVRNQPMIVTVDTVTKAITNSQDLTGANNILSDASGDGSVGYTRGVFMSPTDGEHLYVLLHTNAHMYESGSDGRANLMTEITIVKLRRSDLIEVSRLVVVGQMHGLMAKHMAFSADGSRAALPLHFYYATIDEDVEPDSLQGKLFVVDIASMSVVDGDTVAAGNQPFEVSPGGEPVEAAAMNADGSKVYMDLDGVLSVLDVSTGNMSATAQPPNPPTDGYLLLWGPDGRLYWLGNGHFHIYDLGTDSYDAEVAGTFISMFFSPDAERYLLMRNSSNPDNGQWFNISNDAIVNSPAAGTATTDVGDGYDGHSQAMTPF